VAAYRSSNCAEEDGVGGLGGLERLVGDGGAVSVDGAAAHEVLLEVELEIRSYFLDRFEHLDALDHDLWAAVVSGKHDDIEGCHVDSSQ
jgi:hypothetical protein